MEMPCHLRSVHICMYISPVNPSFSVLFLDPGRDIKTTKERSLTVPHYPLSPSLLSFFSPSFLFISSHSSSLLSFLSWRIETRFHIFHTRGELSMQQKMPLNSWWSCLYLPSFEIIGCKPPHPAKTWLWLTTNEEEPVPKMQTSTEFRMVSG